MLQGPTASLGIYIDSGSVWETAETTGASNLLEYMAFKSTPHRSSFRIMREVAFLNITAHRWDSTLTPETCGSYLQKHLNKYRDHSALYASTTQLEALLFQGLSLIGICSWRA